MRVAGRVFGTKYIADALKLDRMVDQHVVPCVFHIDSGPSLSVNLRKGLFFCHGGCSEPKGGGVLEFVIKWVRLKEGKTLTRQEAKRRVTSLYTLPTARDFLIEMQRDEILMFASTAAVVFADSLRTLDKLERVIMAQVTNVERDFTDDVWDTLANIYHARPPLEWAWDLCRTAHGVTPRLVALYSTFRARGWWSSVGSVDSWTHTETNRQKGRRLRHTMKEIQACRDDAQNQNSVKP